MMLELRSHYCNDSLTMFSSINTNEHVGEMVGVSLNLTNGLKLEPWEYSCVMW